MGEGAACLSFFFLPPGIMELGKIDIVLPFDILLHI